MEKKYLNIFLQPVRTRIGALVYRRRTNRFISDFDEFLRYPASGSSGKPIGRALVSYIVQDLLPPPGKRDTSTFSNAGIAQYIPRALNELGYSVDIVNFDNRHFLPTKKYDLFLGHGGINFRQIEEKLPESCTRIYFSTGIYWQEWNRMEKARLHALCERRGTLLPADRFIDGDEEYANTHADGIICLGNAHAKETYCKFPLVINVNNAVYPDTYDLSRKNFMDGRNNFLFFNGPGNVHKGLDLLLDAFSQLDQHLFVRQTIDPGFFRVYKRELTDCPNIHVVPYLKKPSGEFTSLMNTCNLVISPTCAEGQPGSVIECMAHGLIPILSKDANIDTKDFGISLRENTVEEIISVVNDVSNKPEDWHRLRSFRTREEVRQYYTPEHFLNNMKEAIRIVIGRRTGRARKISEG